MECRSNVELCFFTGPFCIPSCIGRRAACVLCVVSFSSSVPRSNCTGRWSCHFLAFLGVIFLRRIVTMPWWFCIVSACQWSLANVNAYTSRCYLGFLLTIFGNLVISLFSVSYSRHYDFYFIFVLRLWVGNVFIRLGVVWLCNYRWYLKQPIKCNRPHLTPIALSTIGIKSTEMVHEAIYDVSPLVSLLVSSRLEKCTHKLFHWILPTVTYIYRVWQFSSIECSINCF